jgi:hypothetical protein
LQGTVAAYAPKKWDVMRTMDTDWAGAAAAAQGAVLE